MTYELIGQAQPSRRLSRSKVILFKRHCTHTHTHTHTHSGPTAPPDHYYNGRWKLALLHHDSVAWGHNADHECYYDAPSPFHLHSLTYYRHITGALRGWSGTTRRPQKHAAVSQSFNQSEIRRQHSTVHCRFSWRVPTLTDSIQNTTKFLSCPRLNARAITPPVLHGKPRLTGSACSSNINLVAIELSAFRRISSFLRRK